MKRQLCTIALSGLLAIGMSAAASAQDAMQPQGGDAQQGSMQGPGGMRHGMDPDQQLAHMTKRYNLSADQQTQLKPILVDHQQQMMAMHSDTSMSRQDKMAKMQSMQQDHMQKVEAVLTPEQKTKFEADQAKMKERRMERMHGGGDMGAPDASAPPPPPAS
jgi:protein CpxP